MFTLKLLEQPTVSRHGRCTVTALSFVFVLPGGGYDGSSDGIPPVACTVTCLDICSRVGLRHQTQTRRLSFHQHIQETSKHHSISDLTWLHRTALSTNPKVLEGDLNCLTPGDSWRKPWCQRTLSSSNRVEFFSDKRQKNNLQMMWASFLFFSGCVFGVMHPPDKRQGRECVMIKEQGPICSRISVCVWLHVWKEGLYPVGYPDTHKDTLKMTRHQEESMWLQEDRTAPKRK